jgi:glycine cleavage system aminomethyltransferase T
VGTPLSIEVLGERRQATVVRESPYDPDNLELRA